jgi:hypothetical protein
MRCGRILALLGIAFAVGAPSQAEPDYRVRYAARLLPAQGVAEASIQVQQTDAALREVHLDIDSERFIGFAGDGRVAADEDEVVWLPPAGGGRLRYRVKVDHIRDPAEYDARCTEQWALFRGTDLFPPILSRTRAGARADATLELRVPPRWKIETPLPEIESGVYKIPSDGMLLPRPRGWMLAGKIQVERTEIAGVKLTLAAPRQHDARLRDIVALLRWTLPSLREAAGGLPERLLVVLADDPMWRGGLSGPQSLYVHTDRPLIDPDGTSPVLHEVVHVLIRARARTGGDWILEGLSEYYSIEMLHRSGTISDEEYAATLRRLEKRGARAGKLQAAEVGGDVTSRAVTILHQLDEWIREQSKGERSLDHVLAALREDPAAISLPHFLEVIESSTGLDASRFLAARVS